MSLGIAVMALVLMLGLALGAVGAGVSSYVAASNAADAAALAAAPVTFRPFGAQGSPRAEAARFARLNGALLVSCACPVNRSWAARTVNVKVVRRLSLPIIGTVKVSAVSRATFEPAALIPQTGR